MKVTITFEPGEAASAAQLVAQIGEIGGIPASHAQGSAAAKPASQTSLPEVIRLYEKMSENESPRLLEALTAQPLLFEEIGARMASEDGKTRSAASVRAIYRNVRRREKTLLESGVLSGYVVKVEWGGYDQEGAGRYYVDPDALKELDAYLGR